MDNIEIIEVMGKGRGMMAKKNFKIGEVITKEDPYAVIVMNGNHKTTCHYCLECTTFGPEVKSMSKCSGCNFARYCDRDCQKKAWKEHKLECKAVRCVAPGLPSDKTKMVARILWSRLRNEMEAGPVKIADLDAHLSDRSEACQKDLDDHVFDFGDYFGYDDLPENVNDEELRHLFSIIDCNAIGINDRKGLQAIAVAIYPTCSMMNHDCDPTAVAINNGKKLEVRALKDLKEGDEITICYVQPTLTKEERQKKTLEQYYFKCECKFCTEGCEADELKYAFISDDVTQKSKDYILGFTKNVMKRIESSKRKENWERMSNQVNGALMQMDALMSDTHVLKLAVLNHGVEVHSFLQQQGLAVEQAIRVAEAYKKLLPKIHPLLGLWLMRLGILQWQMEKLEDALESLKKASNIISKTHGESHVIFNDLLGLIQQCMYEQHLPKHARHMARVAKVRAGHNLPTQ